MAERGHLRIDGSDVRRRCVDLVRVGVRVRARIRARVRARVRVRVSTISGAAGGGRGCKSSERTWPGYGQAWG